MWKYAVLISYLGTDFLGWQKQKILVSAPAELSPGVQPSIQSAIEKALQQITREDEIRVIGSGRTDSGVHAAGQVAHFVLKAREWPTEILQKALNGVLPKAIRILGVQQVRLDFHAQRSAEKKQYSYYFQQGPCPLPHLETTSWWIQKRLHVEKMNEGLRYLLGEHDFKPFQASGAKPGPTVRQICEAEVSRMTVAYPDGFHSRFELIRVRVLGTGFLKQMVRGIAGTLLQVGEARRSPDCFQKILQTLDRSEVGPTAPSRALWLEKVWYPESFGLLWKP